MIKLTGKLRLMEKVLHSLCRGSFSQSLNGSYSLCVFFTINDFLQMVTNCCHSLQGLNLMHIHAVREVECQINRILNDIKLTHLAVELCAIIPVDENKRYKRQLTGLLKKCIHLQALEAFCGYCEYCRSIGDEDLMLLSHFPSLQHCMLTHSPGMDIVVNTCLNLKYF